MRRPSWLVCIATALSRETMVWYRPLEDAVACSPTLEESFRRATTQELITEGGSLVSPGLASQRDRFLTAEQGRLLYQRHCSKTPRSRGVGTPSWAGPLTTSLRGLWVSGYLPRAMADREQGRRPENRLGGDDSDPGLASRRERGLNCHQMCYSRTSVDCSIRKGAGAQRPWSELREGIVAYSLCEPTSCFLWWSPGSVHRQSAESPCYASETWYPQWYCSKTHRRVPTGAVSGQIALNEWCLVVTVQTTVEVPQLLGVPVEIPQVQFLDKFDTPIVFSPFGFFLLE